MISRVRTYFRGFRPRDAVALALLALAVATLGVVGTAYVQGEGYCIFSVSDTFIYVGIWTLVFAAVTLAVDLAYEFALPRWYVADARKPRRHRIRLVLTKITPRWTKRSVLLGALVMFALWLPYAIIDYPDSILYDTYFQIRQAYPEYHPTSLIPFDTKMTAGTLTDAYFTDHHPIFDTLLFAAFGAASHALTGDWAAGIFVYVLLQGAVTALALTAGVAYLHSRSCPLPLCFAMFAFFCLMPFYACYATAMMKDGVFCMAYIPYFILLAELVRTRAQNLRRTRTLVWFIVLGVLLCLTRKMGMYLVVPTALVAALLYKQQWMPLVAQALACLLTILVVLPYGVFPLLNVAPGGKQEAVSPLYQQTAKFYKDHYEDVTTPEWVVIGNIMPTEDLSTKYVSDTHDSIKFTLNWTASADDFADYLGVWAAQGLRHPESYLSAIMGIAGEFFSFEGRTSAYIVDTAFNLNEASYDYIVERALRRAEGNAESLERSTISETSDGLTVKEDEDLLAELMAMDQPIAVQPDWLTGPRHALADAYETVSGLPGIMVLFTNATYLFWLPCIALFVAWRRRLPMKLLFVPFAIVLFFCVVGPTASTRYALPSIYTAPLLMGTVAAFIRMQWHPPRMRVRVRRKKPDPASPRGCSKR